MLTTILVGALLTTSTLGGTANFYSYQGSNCMGTATNSTVTGCLGAGSSFSLMFYCLANNKYGQGLWQSSGNCSGNPDIYQEIATNVGTGCTLAGQRVTSCGGTDTAPTAPASNLRAMMYSDNACSTLASTMTIALTGTCFGGSEINCGSLESYQFQWYNCTGPQFQYGKGVSAGQCQNDTSGGGWGTFACTQPTAPAARTKSLTATALNTISYTDNTCTTISGYTQWSTGMCAQTSSSGQWTQVTCTAGGTSGTVSTYSAAGCSGTATQTWTVDATCKAVNGEWVKFDSCGAAAAIPTGAASQAKIFGAVVAAVALALFK